MYLDETIIINILINRLVIMVNLNGETIIYVVQNLFALHHCSLSCKCENEIKSNRNTIELCF